MSSKPAINETVLKIHEALGAVSGDFGVIWDEAEENAKFFRLDQYTSDQLTKISGENRTPYILDYITLGINTILGDQRDNRTDIAYYPVEASDDVKVEVANFLKDSILKNNRWLHTESDMFQDGIVERMGCVGFEWTDEKNPLGELRIFRIPPRQIVWDLNRRDYEIEKSQWVARIRLYDKPSLIYKHPKFRKQIEDMSFTNQDIEGISLPDSYAKMIISDQLGAVAAVEYYERDFKTRYFVKDKRTGIFVDDNFDTQKDADAFVRERLGFWQGQVVPKFAEIFGGSPPEPQYEVRAKEFPVVKKSEICQKLVFVEEEEQDAPFFPYEAFYPLWHDGEYWGVVDQHKDGQKFINKMFMEVDHQIGRSQKGLLMVDDKVPQKLFDQLKEIWSKTGGAMQVPDPEHNIKYIQPDSFDPKLLMAMDAVITNMEKKFGGLNLLGQKESSGEAGVTVRQRIERGAMSSFIIFDNFDRTKISVGEKLLWYMTNYVTSAQKIRIEGDELTKLAKEKFPDWYEESKIRPNSGFFEINTVKQNTIESLRADTIIDKSRHSVTKNQTTLAQLAGMLQSSPLLAETLSPILLIQLFDLPATIKERAIRDTEQNMQARAEREKAEAVKPPSLSASLQDITLFEDDPQAQAQFAAHFGIQISNPVEDKEEQKLVTQHLLDQEVRKQDEASDDKKQKIQMATKLAQMMNDQIIEDKKVKKSRGESD